MAVRLLVIDDSPEVAALVRWLARRLGQQVTVATNAEHALEIFTQQPKFDLILVDVNLPAMDGIELCRRVLRLPGEWPLAVFIQSGLVDDLIRAIQVGVEYVLYKDCLVQPELWHARCEEILSSLSGRIPEQNLLYEQDTRAVVDSPILTLNALRQVFTNALGMHRAPLASALITSVWQRMSHSEGPPDPPPDLAPSQVASLASSLVIRLWRLFGTVESQAVRLALVSLISSGPGGEPTP